MTPDQTPTPEQRLNARSLCVSRILADRRFNHAEKLLYIHLLVLCDEQGICRMTGRELFKMTDISTGTISTALAHLEELGYLRSNREQREGGRRGAYLIRILTEVRQPPGLPQSSNVPPD